MKPKDCDICRYESEINVPAEFDAKTKQGPWAYMCVNHFKTHAMHQTLGVGKGQHHPKRFECTQFCNGESP